ncbi:MAG: protealysin inhibitor emfourin [Actinomycetales bacterium]
MTDVPDAGSAGLVEVTRSGGFAGLTLRGRVDLDQLTGADRAAWDVALQERLSGLAPHEPAPDRFVYRVSRPAVGFEVTVGEHELPDDVRALLDRAVLPPD